MRLEDYHTHNLLCNHAKGKLEDYVKKAINKKDLDLIGFSDHFPFEYLTDVDNLPHEEYAMRLNQIEGYLSAAKNLRKKYKNKIEIRIGFEIDYIENQTSQLNLHLSKISSDLDYIIGSIHVLYSDHGVWGIDDSRFSKDFNAIGVDNVYLQYYSVLRDMIKNKDFDFDIIGHFDLPKKFNQLPSIEFKERIEEEVSKTLELAKERDIVIEVNTSGFRKEVKEQYPSESIIKKMYELDIPTLLGSDSHDPNELAYEFKNMINTLKKIGYKQLASFKRRKRSFIKI
ncbi:MAG: histidinol-phosphatase HisJ [Candidatus Lokiarchaeota archaeon]|nr:histidinol-phosphatase HisJ [Candidatus Lokiarchaeota archaeon]